MKEKNERTVLCHDGPDGKDVANVGIVQNSRKKMSKIQKNVQK
jgi:hypothetical protein